MAVLCSGSCDESWFKPHEVHIEFRNTLSVVPKAVLPSDLPPRSPSALLRWLPAVSLLKLCSNSKAAPGRSSWKSSNRWRPHF